MFFFLQIISTRSVIDPRKEIVILKAAYVPKQEIDDYCIFEKEMYEKKITILIIPLFIHK